MSFDRDRLSALAARYGTIARIVVAEVKGSTPRGPGTAMCLWGGGASGTIGGGALEWEAMTRARAALADGSETVLKYPLGPALGQCCGGYVLLSVELWDTQRLEALEGSVVARPLPGSDPAMPPKVSRLLASPDVRPGVTDGWLVEPVSRPARSVWIYGSGHVGRALATVLAPLPDFAVTLVDAIPERLPDPLPDGITPMIASEPPDAVAHAPDHAEHFVMTYSHAMDLEICHRLLRRTFRSAGVIGSATKHARFRSRLADLGHSPEEILRIRCPIGDPDLGKEPQAIAIGIAADLLRAHSEVPA